MPIEYPIDGIFLLDKPLGMTSNAALQKVKRLFKAKKAGHTGSLDPLATGMLPICFGEATKFSQFLLDENKYYRVEGLLGVKTTTGDKEGEIIESKETHLINLPALQAQLLNFIGEISQCPPMYSALKVDGVALYKLARQGINIERKSRIVKINNIQLLRAQSPYFELDVWCTKGTYIRTLIEDIGDALGCGAHVTKLHRLGVGDFLPEQMHRLIDMENLSDLNEFQRDKFILPVDAGLNKLPAYYANNAELNSLSCGKKILVNSISGIGLFRLYSKETQKFAGLIDINEESIVKVRRLLQQTTKAKE